MRDDVFGHLIVMAKPPIPGYVKTRLIGALTAQQAADIHAAMLECVLERCARLTQLSDLQGQWRCVLAVDDSHGSHACSIEDPWSVSKAFVPYSGKIVGWNKRSASHPRATVGVPATGGRGGFRYALPTLHFSSNDALGWFVRTQGVGDLGQRLGHVWRQVGGGPVIFLGVDSPDVPTTALTEAIVALNENDVAVGPAIDGGYWTLACRRYDERLIHGIDWGTVAVYDQTVEAAREAGLKQVMLPRWHDVDTPDDLDTLRQRINCSDDPMLRRLKARLDRVCATR